MKKALLTLATAMVALTAAAELREDAFIIRTNDGAAQGLLFGDVEKITFSNLDDEGVPHTGIFYQELHFPDTIIRTPVSDIMEVSFEKPKVKYQPDVVLMSQTGMVDYVSNFRETDTGYQIYISKTIPAEIRPQVGQKIAYMGEGSPVFGKKAIVGKITSVTLEGWFYYVDIEPIDGIHDLYEELVGVESISDDNPHIYAAIAEAGALPKDDNGKPKSRFDDTGDATIPKFEFNISKEFKWDDKSNFSITGGVKGSIELRLAYEFTRKRSFLSVGSTYDYTPFFKFAFSADEKWEKLFWDPSVEPIIEITAPSAPIFTIYMGMSPFIKLTGQGSVSIEKTLPTTKTRTLTYYLDGIYRSGKCDATSPEDKGIANKGKLDINIDFEGSFHAGMCVGLYVGTTRIFKSAVGIGAEAYIGPKITGTIGTNFNIPPDLDTPTPIAYNMLKNRQVSVSWCSIDLELNYFRELLGKYKKEKICDMSFDLNATSMSILPEFEAPDWSLPEMESFTGWQYISDIRAKATVTMGSPSGNSLLPVRLGIGVYSEEDDWWYYYWTDQRDPKYWMGTKGDPRFESLEWDDFEHWFPNKKYKLYPLFQIPGINYPFLAEPYRSVMIETEPLTTGDCTHYNLTRSQRKWWGVTMHGSLGEKYLINPHVGMDYCIGFLVDINREPVFTQEYKSTFLPLPRDLHKTTFSASMEYPYETYPAGTTFNYRAVIYYGSGFGCDYGEVKTFTIPKLPE